MKKYVTITEIAQKLGVSHSTVSRALNGHPRISVRTTEKVQKLAQEMGYRSNKMISNFKKGRSGLVGVIVPDLSISYFAKVIEGLQKELMQSDYSLLLYNTEESLELEREAVSKCLAYRVDAVVAAMSMETNRLEHFEGILKQNVPLVFFDRVANFLPVPKVIIDDYQASYQANSYLIKSGCKYIAHIAGSRNLNNSNNRLYGYLDALRDHDLKSDERLVHYYDHRPLSVEQFLRKTLKEVPKLDGLTAFNDYVAFQAIEILEEIGKAVPEEISVFGFSDEPIANYMRPKLSTVQQVAPNIGRLTGQKVVALLSGAERIADEKIVVKPTLIVRDTVRKF